MNLSKNYIALTENRMTKSEFLRQARQSFPHLIGAGNSFDDALKILTRRGLINEELIYQNKADKFPLEAIERGIRYELEVMDVYDIHHPSQEQYKKARQRAIDNLCKDPLYYINKIADGCKQPTQEETEGDLKKVTPSKKNLQEGRYMEEGDLSMHKDINMNADLGGGEEAPAKKAQAPRTKYKDNHNWTVNDYKIAYILAEFGKKGLPQIFAKFGSQIDNANLKLLANIIIGTTDAGLQFAVQGMKKVISGEQNGDWLISYFHNNNALQAYRELDGKSFEESLNSLSNEKCSDEEAAAAREAQNAIDAKNGIRGQEANAATKQIVRKATDRYKLNRANFIRRFGGDKVKGEKAAVIDAFKSAGYDIDDPRRATLWAYLRDSIDINSEALRALDAKLGVNNSNAAAFKSKNLKEQEISEAPLEDNPQMNKKFLDLYIKYKDGNYQVKDKESGELKPGKKLAPETAAQKACMVVRKVMNAPRFRPDRNTIASCSTGRGKLQYQGERDGVPTFNYAWSLKEKKATTMRPDEGHGRNHVAPERNYEKPDSAGEKYESDPDMQTADKLFVALMARSNSDQKTFKTQADGSERRRTPEECLKLVQKKFPGYKRPFKATMKNFGLTWFRKQDGSVHLELKTVHEAQYGEISKDPVYTQLYQHYLKKAKEAKDVNAEKTARKQAKASYLKYKAKHGIQEGMKGPDQEKMILKEHIIGIIGKILNEAATANLAQLSDENASVAELPGIINSLENIVTEIESFWIKEQQKIQGVFDQVGDIKNEDGLPVGYKFVQPMIESLKKDLEPVLAKITLDDLKLPEAPAPDQTQVNDPNAELDPNDPNAVPPVPEKQTVFSPGKKPLQEQKNKRYTK